MTVAATVLNIARSQLGYQEGYSNGHWNNIQKYSGQVPGLGWSNGQPWCAVFVSWCLYKSGALKLLPGGQTASVAHIRDAGKTAKRFNQYPAIGAIAIFGVNGDAHTGIVESFTATTVTTIEGNTNNNGSSEGDGVYRHTRARSSTWVYGYVYPTYPEGIQSADPTWPKPRRTVPVAKSANPNFDRMRDAALAAKSVNRKGSPKYMAAVAVLRIIRPWSK